MAEGARIIDTPVTDLKWLPRFGRSYKVPEGCLDCEILTARVAAEAVGLTTVETPSGGERYLPLRDEFKAEVELEKRARASADGTCAFVLRAVNCWRKVAIEE